MKIKNKIVSILFVVLMLGGTSCNALKELKLKETDVSLWGVPATYKVTQEVDLKDDSAVKTDAMINLTMARGEYESSQIIITPTKDVRFYDVKVSDLTRVGGTEIFPKEKISVYHEKYLTVKRNKQNNGAPLGNYPDALVPLDAIKEYGENTVAANTNQGIYVTFEADIEQETGVYTGSMQIDFGDFRKDVPIRIDVIDLTVSETVHTKSIFQTDWPFDAGEMNSTQAMMDAYADKLIEYRLSPHRLVKDTAHTDEDIAYYTEKAYGYLINPRCSNIGFPDRQVYDATYGDWITDFPLLRKYIMSFVEKSFETNFNMLEKTVCYFHGLDEPEHNNTLDRVRYVCTLYKQFLIDVANEVRAMPTPTNVSEDFKENVARSIEKIRNVVTCTYREDLVGYVDTWTPAIDKWDGEENQANYADQEERWWYGANNPNYPYPNYDLISSNMSLRMYGWMQADYGIVGNLYWATNNYLEFTSEHKYIGLEEYYTGPAGRYDGDNTEGFLFYPGGQYGLSEPIASMRLESIRDGYEEYELIYALQKKYEQLGFDSEKALASITNSLYLQGRTQFTEDVLLFANARKSLLELCSIANSDAGVCIVDYTDDGRGMITHKIYVEGDTQIQNHGEVLTGGVPQGNGVIYTVQTKLEDGENSLSLRFVSNGIEYEYIHALGGKVTTKSAENLASSFKEDLVAPIVSLEDANKVNTELTGKLVKVVLPYRENAAQRIFFQDELWNELGEKTSKIILRIYNPATEAINFDLAAKYSRSVLYSSYLTGYQLVPGMNEIEINLATVAWNKMGKLDAFVMMFGKMDSEPEKTVYISDVSVYYK